MSGYDLLRERQLRLVEWRSLVVTVTLVRVRVLLVVRHYLHGEHTTRRMSTVRSAGYDRGSVIYEVYPSVGDDLLRSGVHRRPHGLREEVYDGGRLRLVPEYQHARRN